MKLPPPPPPSPAKKKLLKFHESTTILFRRLHSFYLNLCILKWPLIFLYDKPGIAINKRGRLKLTSRQIQHSSWPESGRHLWFPSRRLSKHTLHTSQWNDLSWWILEDKKLLLIQLQNTSKTHADKTCQTEALALETKEVLERQGLLEIHIVFTSQPRCLDPIPYLDIDIEEDADCINCIIPLFAFVGTHSNLVFLRYKDKSFELSRATSNYPPLLILSRASRPQETGLLWTRFRADVVLVE